jgi:hypothetical protein
MSWCRIQQPWDACGWFFGAQVFGEKFLTGDLPRYLKSEPIPHKVGHSALSAAPVKSSSSFVSLCCYVICKWWATLYIIYSHSLSKILLLYMSGTTQKFMVFAIGVPGMWHQTYPASLIDLLPSTTFQRFSCDWLFYNKCNALVTTQILPLCSDQGLEKTFCRQSMHGCEGFT